MNKTIKRNVVVSAILAIMLCVSLIAGATFALFTSESKVNIAVSSGKVDVKASVENLKLYSAETVSKTQATNYQEVSQFTNGGTATFDEDGNLTLDKMTPGDRAAFTIKVTNNGNVAAIYRTSISVSNDTGLYEELDITVDGAAMTTKKTAWKNIDFENKEYNVIVDLPADATAQDVKCTLTFMVEAMQGNAVINDISASQLAAILKNPENGVVTLEKDYEVIDDWTPISIPSGTEIKGNGHYISGLTSSLLIYNHPTITINDLTLRDSVILPSDTTGTGCGAFISSSNNSTETYTFNNCHIDNVTLEARYPANEGNSGSQAGAFLGNIMAQKVVIDNCSVNNSTVKGNSSAAGFVGLVGKEAEIKNSKVENSKFVSLDKGGWRVGAIVGTVGGDAKATVTTCSETGNTFSMPNSEAENPNHGLFGRVSGGTLIVDNTVYCQSAYLANILMASKSVSLDKDYVILNDWTAVNLKNTFSSSALTPTLDSYSIDGNNHSISGLTAALFDSNAVVSMEISNLTIKNSKISGNGADWAGCGAFIMYKDSTGEGSITMTNCHLLNSSVTSTGTGTGALIGYVAQAALTMDNCSAEGCEINGKKNVGGLIGQCQVDEKTYIVKNSTVKNCALEASSETEKYCGQIVGCVTGAGTFKIEDCTYTGLVVKRIALSTATVKVKDTKNNTEIEITNQSENIIGE